MTSPVIPSKILIIDDEIELVRLTTKLLRVSGYDVYCHFEGKGAVNAVDQIRPDLILLDLRLPDCSGDRIFRELHNHPELKKIPVLIFSTVSPSEGIIRKTPGAAGWVGKPYEIEELLSQIRQALQGCQERLS